MDLLQVRIPSEQKSAIAKVAQEHGAYEAQVIRRAIAYYLENACGITVPTEERDPLP